MKADGNPILTIGHSTHSAQAFIALLRMHSVQAIADVRSSPFSRFNPQFNRQALEQLLAANNIEYRFLGLELGARTEDASCYENGRVQYSRLAQTALFQHGIKRVINGSQQFKIALMCAEKDPLECHRTLLVSNALANRGVPIGHIHANGFLESHEAAMDRLLNITGISKLDLFRSREQLLSEALARQEENIAYVSEKMLPTSSNKSPS